MRIPGKPSPLRSSNRPVRPGPGSKRQCPEIVGRMATTLTILAFCFAAGTACQSLTPDPPPDLRPLPENFLRLQVQASHSLRVYASPRLPNSLLSASLLTAVATRARLENLLSLPARAVFDLALYEDPAEYALFSDRDPRLLPGTSSRYDSASRTIHILAQASPGNWRHEWTHALLTDHQPNAPYWLHEGMALLLEETDQIRGRPRLPGRIIPLRSAVVRHVQQGGLEDLLSRRSPGPLAGPTAGWFCAFLDARGLLKAALRKTPDDFRKFQTDFLAWLNDASVPSALLIPRSGGPAPDRLRSSSF